MVVENQFERKQSHWSALCAMSNKDGEILAEEDGMVSLGTKRKLFPILPTHIRISLRPSSSTAEPLCRELTLLGLNIFKTEVNNS